MKCFDLISQPCSYRCTARFFFLVKGKRFDRASGLVVHPRFCYVFPCDLFFGKGWLEQHGKPLEAMQVDMAEIERKNNKLDVQWRNYQVSTHSSTMTDTMTSCEVHT